MTVTLIAAVDRRRPNRVSPPVCPRCGTDDGVTVMNRAPTHVYFHCERCGELLPVSVPAVASGRILVDHLAD
jgi:uncharacterized Zn finger protein